MKKQEVIAILDHLSDPLDPEQLMYELYVREKIERSEEAIARGEVVSHEEVVRQTQEWFDSFPRSSVGTH
jgi:predicted transcriptional regulator